MRRLLPCRRPSRRRQAADAEPYAGAPEAGYPDLDPAAEHGPPLSTLNGRWSVRKGLALTAIVL